MWAMSRRRRGRLPAVGLVLALGAAGWSAPAAAISVIGEDQDVEVIQNRTFKMAHELALEVGLLPIDAYYKGVTGTLRYTWHMSPHVGWELFGVSYSWNWDSRLKEALIEEFGANETTDYEFREAVLIAESNFVLKPFYGKMALFNRAILRSEFFLNLGPAYMLFTPSSTTFTSGLSHRPGLNYGMGLRLFAAEWFSLRVDLRHYIVLAVDAFFLEQADRRLEIDNVLYMGLGGSFNIGYD